MDKKEVLLELQKISATVVRLMEKLSTGDAAVVPSIAQNSQGMVEKLSSENVCLVCKKPIDGKSVRGNHEYCRQLVKDLYPDSEALQMGLLLPASAGGRKPSVVAIKLKEKAEEMKAMAEAVDKKKSKKKD
jgi:hypothetical protein